MEGIFEMGLDGEEYKQKCLTCSAALGKDYFVANKADTLR
jgi:hypothetical protein